MHLKSHTRRHVPKGPRKERLRKQSVWAAFTLVEILIAITILATVMIAIYASWSAILRGSKAGLDAAAQAQRTRVTLRAIEESLASVRMFGQNARYYSFLTDTSGDFAAISFVARLSPSFPGSGLFENEPVRRVTFMVEPGTNSPTQLVLLQTPLLEPEDTADEPYRIILATNISTFALDFWDTNANEWIPEWISTNQMPRLMRVTLGFGNPKTDHSQRGVEATRIIALGGIPVPLAYQVGGGAGGAQRGAPPRQDRGAQGANNAQGNDNFFRDAARSPFDRSQLGTGGRFRPPDRGRGQ